MRGRTLILGLAFLSCGRAPATDGTSVEGPLHVALGGDAVARVGDVVLPVSLVSRVAGAQRVEPRVALDRLIDDALASQGARASGAASEPGVTWTLESVLGRATASRVHLAAQAAGPVTDDELEQVTQRHWLDVDLPEQIRVVHAVVLKPKDPSQNDAARALAQRIASAVSGATSEADFKARATAVPHDPFQVVVETLDPFVADGRVAKEPFSTFDQAFVDGAFTLKNVGDTSAPVASSFGWHVIRLLERLPAKHVPAAERRVRFLDEVVTHRATVALNAIFKAHRASTSIGILPDAEARMAAATPRESP